MQESADTTDAKKDKSAGSSRYVRGAMQKLQKHDLSKATGEQHLKQI